MSNKKYRSKEEIKTIDHFLTEHYSSKGVSFCAEELGETSKYIGVRATTLKLKLNKDLFVKSRSAGRSAGLKTLQRLNKELRSENFKLIVENRNLKKRFKDE